MRRQTHMLNELPEDVVRTILDLLPARSLSKVACTCRALRDMAADAAINLSLVPANNWPARDWALEADREGSWPRRLLRARRVASLHARRCMYGACAWVHNFKNLKRVDLAFCRVSPMFMDVLPRGVTSVAISKLNCGVHDVFHTKSLDRFSELRDARIVLGRGWDLAIVDSQGPSNRLEIRRAPAIVVRTTPRANTLVLDCEDGMLTSVPIASEIVRLRCDTAPIRTFPTEARELTITCAGRVEVPFVRGLRTLRLACDVGVLSNVVQVQNLHVRVNSLIANVYAFPPGSTLEMRGMPVEVTLGGG